MFLRQDAGTARTLHSSAHLLSFRLTSAASDRLDTALRYSLPQPSPGRAAQPCPTTRATTRLGGSDDGDAPTSQNLLASFYGIEKTPVKDDDDDAEPAEPLDRTDFEAKTYVEELLRRQPLDRFRERRCIKTRNADARFRPPSSRLRKLLQVHRGHGDDPGHERERRGHGGRRGLLRCDFV